MRLASSLVAALLAASAGCTGTDITEAPASGMIRVITTSSGPDIDADGFVVRIGSQAFPVAATDTLFLAVPVGDHRLALEGLSANCHPSGADTRDVRAVTSTVSEVAFQVTCVATYGVVEVSVTSAGTDLNPTGYLLTVEAAFPESQRTVPVPLAASLHFRIADGVTTTAVTLGSLPANCSVEGDNPRAVSVEIGGAVRDTVRTTFAVTCQPLPTTATLSLTVTTRGADIDPDGYLGALDCVPGFDDIPECRSLTPVDANGTASIRVPLIGPHTIELWGVAPNCRVLGPPVRPLFMPPGTVTVEVEFEVTCVASGALRIATPTTGTDLDADGYQVALLNGVGGVVSGFAVPVNGSLTIPVLPGTYRLRLDGVAFNCDRPGTPERAVTVAEGQTLDVTWAIACHDAPELAFSGMFSGALRVLRVKTNDETPYPVGPGDAYAPAWSPDGTRIAYTRWHGAQGEGDIHVMNADGTGDVRLTSHPADDREPVWSPDGARLLFWSRRDGRAQIYVINADGSGLGRVTTANTEDYSPAWSPDGSRIAFVRNGGIYVANANGSGVVRLTTGGGPYDNTPVWSPDGDRLVFSRWACLDDWECPGTLHTVRPDGSSLVALGVAGWAPSWSRDGQWIVFTTDGVLEAVRPDGSDRRVIGAGQIGPAFPDWRP